MKLVKFAPAIVATFVLAACSTANQVVSTATDAVKATGDAVTTVVDTAAGAVTKTTEVLNTKNKSVVYTCNKGAVTATYAFHNGELKGANVRLGKNTEISGFVVNKELSNEDSLRLSSDKYLLSVEPTLSFETAEKTNLVMLFERAGEVDNILAKNCSINAAATKKLNK